MTQMHSLIYEGREGEQSKRAKHKAMKSFRQVLEASLWLWIIRRSSSIPCGSDESEQFSGGQTQERNLKNKASTYRLPLAQFHRTLLRWIAGHMEVIVRSSFEQGTSISVKRYNILGLFSSHSSEIFRKNKAERDLKSTQERGNIINSLRQKVILFWDQW